MFPNLQHHSFKRTSKDFYLNAKHSVGSCATLLVKETQQIAKHQANDPATKIQNEQEVLLSEVPGWHYQNALEESHSSRVSRNPQANQVATQLPEANKAQARCYIKWVPNSADKKKTNTKMKAQQPGEMG